MNKTSPPILMCWYIRLYTSAALICWSADIFLSLSPFFQQSTIKNIYIDQIPNSLHMHVVVHVVVYDCWLSKLILCVYDCAQWWGAATIVVCSRLMPNTVPICWQIHFSTLFPNWISQLYFPIEILNCISQLNFLTVFPNWISQLYFPIKFLNFISQLKF